ncbi:MAG: hypothetical protein N2508_07710 [Anaerolineae bacterium]|nr:hypothetical protein [Anaerolineae bacterium]
MGKVDYAGEIAEVWAKPLVDGSIAVGLFNLGNMSGRLIGVAWESLGLDDRRPCLVRDLWAHEDIGVFTGDFTARVDSHDVALVRITPQR